MPPFIFLYLNNGRNCTHFVGSAISDSGYHSFEQNFHPLCAVFRTNVCGENLPDELMSKIEICDCLKDVEYANGANEQRAMNVCWLASFGLINVSFYERGWDDLLFAEDFDLQTAIKLRDCLNGVIEAAAKDRTIAENAEANRKTTIADSKR